MPIQLPKLDNKTFKELMDEMIASIPKYTTEWTNFNPSDPGITVLELLAWITENLLYRINRVPEETFMNFLYLITGTSPDDYGTESADYGDNKIKEKLYDKRDKMFCRILEYILELKRKREGGEEADIKTMQAAALEFLNSRYRAISLEDFRELALDASNLIKRAFVFKKRYSIEIVIAAEPEDIDQSLINTVRDYLDPRRLIGTIVDVRFPFYTSLKLKVIMACKSYADIPTTLQRVKDTITHYLDPLRGGPEGQGWDFGRNLMVYELFHIIGKTEGVDHVAKVVDISGESELTFNRIEIDELPRLDELVVEVTDNE